MSIILGCIVGLIVVLLVELIPKNTKPVEISEIHDCPHCGESVKVKVTFGGSE